MKKIFYEHFLFYSLFFIKTAVMKQKLQLLLLLLFCFLMNIGGMPQVHAQVSISGIINDYTSVSGIIIPTCQACDVDCRDSIIVNDPSAFSPGDKALIIQMKGANINTANSPAGGAITAINNAGNYEFFEIESINGNLLIPKYRLIRPYTASGLLQVIRIPDYGKQEVNINGTLQAQDWNPATSTGGVLALRAEKVVFNADIDVLGAGFQGIQMPINGTPDNCSVDPATQYVLPNTDASSYEKGNGIVVDDPNTNRGRAPRANGGGAGVSGDSGGGGGSNYGTGGNGGWRWCDEQGPQDGGPDLPAGGVGGQSLTTYLAQDKVFLGGAGGPGWVSTSNPSTAADGGGVVIIFADTIVGNGHSIIADGTSPVAVNPVGPPDGGGGGGAGGSIVLKVNTFNGNLNVSANGGTGQDLNTTNYHGPGAGGGGGVLLYSLAAIPANVTFTAAGGREGRHSDGFPNGATAGSAGGSISLYVPIQNPNYETNLDNDTTLSSCDIDDDNDGIPDIVEIYNGDHDGDGTPDYLDGDFCNDVFQGVNGWDCAVDGLPDPSGDMDGDGRVNYKDADFPYCASIGVGGDAVCSNFDLDGDGQPNHADLDADDDGIPDIIEGGGTDTDGDGQADIDADIDGDGLVDHFDNDLTDGPTGTSPCGNPPGCLATTSTTKLPVDDTDADAVFNFLDRDTDNDGIPDIVEAGGTDVNGDGRADNYVDIDDDGFNDIYDGAVLTSSGTPLFVTGADTDSDGQPESYIGAMDTDNDGFLDLLDLDADNDGIPDVVEAGGTDVNGDGIADNYVDNDNDGYNDVVDGDPTNSLTSDDDGAGSNTTHAQQLTGADTDGDGSPNSFPNDDTDNDGVVDQLDLDADNDGIPDVVEAGGTDVDGDGIADNYVDTDNDGYNDVVDGDPSNSLALGNDGNGSNTANAQQLTGADSDNDGQPNSYPEGDTDGDMHLDQLDLDADNDGIPDIVEAGGSDIDNNGMVDVLTNPDNDGYSNLYDTDTDNDGTTDAGPTVLINTTADGTNDGRPDNGMAKGQFDNDNIPNHLDLDADNDGILDVVEAGLSAADTDRDGILDDAITNDIDNNGWSNTADQGNGGTSPVQTTDGDSDGYPNVYTTTDAESDVHPNFLDIDADNDGIVDNTEGQATESYIAPVLADADNDGIDNAYDNNDALFGGTGSGITPQNKENTGQADYLDLDTDDDGEDDSIEGHDTNGDGVVDGTDSPNANTGIGGATDTDNDGLLDGFDNNTASTDPTNSSLQGFSHPDVDNPGSTERDWREANTTYAVDDINSTPVNTNVGGNVLTNDFDLENHQQLLTTNITIDTDGDGVADSPAPLGTPVNIAGVNENGSPNPNAGTITQNANGDYLFVPTAGFLGEITYTYHVCDNGAPVACDSATVTIDVEPAPTTDNGTVAVSPDVNITHNDIPVSGQVLANDNDPDNDPLVVSGTIDVDTDGDGTLDATAGLGVTTNIGGINTDGGAVGLAGTVTQNANGTYTFDPVSGFVGVVEYQYTACDDDTPTPNCEVTTVTIRVLPTQANTTVANDDEEFMDKGTTLTENVLTNDSDVEGDTQIGGVTLVTGPSNGSLTLNTDGTYSYTPVDPNFIGNDEFVYSVCDDGTPQACDTATVYITILEVNRDYGDAGLPIAWHRAIRDANMDNTLDGTTDVWLGFQTNFEFTSAVTDNFDDAMTQGMGPGQFPTFLTAAQVFNVDITLNASVTETVSYGLWIDWDNDGTFDDFYNGAVATTGPTVTSVAVTTPATFNSSQTVNIRLRADDEAFAIGDFAGERTNGEVEDFQIYVVDLPVELLHFNAKLEGRNTAELDWATASETNNEGFYIEHALPATGAPDFQTIGFVDGQGTTVSTTYYQEEVPNLTNGTHYFRLKQVDFDGSFEYSETKALTVAGTANKDVYPTYISASQNSLFVKVAEEGDYTIRLFDAVGQAVVLYQGKLSPTTYHEVDLNRNELVSGVYFLQVSSNEASFTEKIRME